MLYRSLLLKFPLSTGVPFHPSPSHIHHEHFFSPSKVATTTFLGPKRQAMPNAAAAAPQPFTHSACLPPLLASLFPSTVLFSLSSFCYALKRISWLLFPISTLALLVVVATASFPHSLLSFPALCLYPPRSPPAWPNRLVTSLGRPSSYHQVPPIAQSLTRDLHNAYLDIFPDQFLIVHHFDSPRYHRMQLARLPLILHYLLICYHELQLYISSSCFV